MINISSNTLVDFITSGRNRRVSLVRALIRSQDKGYAPFYSSFDKPASSYVETGADDVGIIQSAVYNLPRTTGSKWQIRNRKNTILAFKDLFLMRRCLRELGCWFERIKKKRSYRVVFPGLSIGVSPALLTHDTWIGKGTVGSLRFYLAKSNPYELGAVRAELMAALQYKWLHDNFPDLIANPDLCFVVEVFQLRITRCPPNVEEVLTRLEVGAREFVTLWTELSQGMAA